jgi:hypothetical protein
MPSVLLMQSTRPLHPWPFPSRATRTKSACEWEAYSPSPEPQMKAKLNFTAFTGETGAEVRVAVSIFEFFLAAHFTVEFGQLQLFYFILHLSSFGCVGIEGKVEGLEVLAIVNVTDLQTDNNVAVNVTFFNEAVGRASPSSANALGPSHLLVFAECSFHNDNNCNFGIFFFAKYFYIFIFVPQFDSFLVLLFKKKVF